MVTVIVALFVIGYACIALESVLKINKAATALLMCVACWVLYMIDAGTFIQGFHGITVAAGEVSNWVGENVLIPHMGDTCEILFFLMGAMAIVETVDANGGFNFVREMLRTTNKRKLLWSITFMTFFLSAILDNMTTSIVMVMVLRKLVPEHKERIIFAALVILAANAGGAFSPIGDVTTIMLWIKGNITTLGVMKELFIPSLVSVIVPALVLQFSLKGELQRNEVAEEGDALQFSSAQRTTVFVLGVGGLIFVPIFRFLTGLPPFMGILLILGLLWLVTESFYRSRSDIEESAKLRLTRLISRIDMGTIFFFLGILMTVATLQETSVLANFGRSLDEVSGGNHYLVTGVIGCVSAVVDNVPLVAGCMGMYDIAPSGDMAADGIFWQLLAYCAGVGGSMLIIGSAAGVVVMGLEKISFGWYLRHVSWIALLGYLAGIGAYWVEKTVIGM